MPPLEEMDRPEVAVWLPETTRDDYNEPLMGTAVEINVKWEDDKRPNWGKEGDDPIRSVTIKVDREMRSGWVWKGSLAEWGQTGSVANDGSLLQVTDYQEVKDLKGRFVDRFVTLAYFREETAPDR